MVAYQSMLENTTSFIVSSNGRVAIFSESRIGAVDSYQSLTQSVELNVEQSKDLYQRLRQVFGEDVSVDSSVTPVEPEEPGWYLTQSGELLLKDADHDWSRRNDVGGLMSWIDRDGVSIGYTYHWDDVVRTLGTGEFPLVRISQEDRVQYVKTVTAQSKN